MYCELCMTALPPGKGATSHFTGKKHLANVAIQQRREECSERSVFVTGFPAGTLELQLMDYFSHFGSVAEIILDKNKGTYAIVQFAEKVARDTTLAHGHHTMSNIKLVVKPRILKKNLKRNFEAMSRTESDEFPEIYSIQEMQSVAEQMVTLLNIISQTQEELYIKEQICHKLKDIFRQFYPGCNLQMYGSTVSGYGFPRCDLDLHFTLPNEEFLGDQATPPTIIEVKEGKKVLHHMTVDGHLKFIQRLLKRYGPSCRNVLFINARCPILRFLHGKSRTLCDISCGNGLSIYNTRLLRLYGELDQRTHLLMMTLRFWAKKRNLLGSGNKFTSYAFTLIVIFYLQTRQPPVAPTVEDLAKLTGSKRIIDKWDCSFCDNLALIPKSKNEESLESLLQGFFQYFSTFDFTTNILSLRLGSTFPRGQMPQTEYICKSSAIAVQDPFDLSHNITETVSGQHLILFLENLEGASKICSSDSWGLLDILLGKFQKPTTDTVLKTNFLKITENTIEIPLEPDILELFSNRHKIVQSESKQIWVGKVLQMVIDLLKRGLQFECSDLTETETEESNSSNENFAKRQRTDYNQPVAEGGNLETCQGLTNKKESCDQKDKHQNSNEMRLHCDLNVTDCCRMEDNHEHATNESCEQKPECQVSTGEVLRSKSNSELLGRINCKAFYQTWVNRKNEAKGFVSTGDNICYLDREEYISRNIISHSTQPREDQPRVEFQCQFFTTDVATLSVFKIFFKVERGEKEFKMLFSFLKSYIPKLVKIILDTELKN